MTDSSCDLRVLVVGAGPSGFYAIHELMKLFSANQLSAHFDLVNRDVRPGGLVTYGVAPDHPSIRAVGKVYQQILDQENVNYFGNVCFGDDFNLCEVCKFYDAIVFAIGAQSDRRLNIPGEDFLGSYSARQFVNWYNGLPDYASLDVDLSCKCAVVAGAGNVAIDVVRVLSRDTAELAVTDISSVALEVLKESDLEEVVVAIRKGPEHVKFSPAELRAIGELEGVDVCLKGPADLLDNVDLSLLDKDSTKNIDTIKGLFQRKKKDSNKKISFLFYSSPVTLQGEDDRLSSVTFCRNEFVDGVLKPLPQSEFSLLSGLFVKAVGYDVKPVAQLPYDSARRVISNQDGRIEGQGFERCYVVGWAADGPVGIIGTNKARARKVAKVVFEDMQNEKKKNLTFDFSKFLKEKNIRFVSKEQWGVLSQKEKERGEKLGKPIDKFLSNDEMFEVLDNG